MFVMLFLASYRNIVSPFNSSQVFRRQKKKEKKKKLRVLKLYFWEDWKWEVLLQWCHNSVKAKSQAGLISEDVK